jgi:replicative DNA helicase
VFCPGTVQPEPGSRGDKPPTISDLRDSGDLKNTADSVIGLYRDEMHHEDSPEKDWLS